MKMPKLASLATLLILLLFQKAVHKVLLETFYFKKKKKKKNKTNIFWYHVLQPSKHEQTTDIDSPVS